MKTIEYKIKIVNKNKEGISRAIMFGGNTFMTAINYGSEKGIEITVTKDGNYIPYTEPLFLSTATPLKVKKTQIASSPKQASQELTHYEQDATGQTKTIPLTLVRQNDFLYDINDSYSINGNSHLIIPVLNNEFLVMILNIENNNIKK